jgi:hypothetical protein
LLNLIKKMSKPGMMVYVTPKIEIDIFKGGKQR